jgi:hypothetical protein
MKDESFEQGKLARPPAATKLNQTGENKENGGTA